MDTFLYMEFLEINKYNTIKYNTLSFKSEKQYPYVGAQDPLYDTLFYEHRSALSTQKQHKSSTITTQYPSDGT